MKAFMKEVAGMMHQADPEAGFAFEFWDGDTIRFGNFPKVTLRLNSENAARRIAGNGFLGFGEAYMDQELDVEGDLRELIRLGLAIQFNQRNISTLQKLRFLISAFRNRDTRRRARENIAYHYDRGNEFYALYLEESMTYSCAYFRTPGDTLEEAQDNKYDHICRKLMLQPGESLVDIGCGWGGMLIYAARHYGISGVGCTISRHQFEYANAKIREMGLQDRIRVVYRDYREMEGQFDKFVSIGMFEHVGKQYHPLFFKKIRQLLKKDGVGLLHSIGKDFPAGRDGWTARYIFPGGYVPTLAEMADGAGEVGFSVLDVENLRLHYARTLDCWLENYEQNADKVREMFDESFVRRWRLFLASSSAGFRYSLTRLFQMTFTHGLNNQLPVTRDHVYSHETSAATF